MQKSTILFLLMLLFACNQPSTNNTNDDATDNTDTTLTNEETALNEEEIVSEIRKEFAEINENAATYKSVKKEIMDESAEGGDLQGFYKDGNLKKIIASYYGETGKSVNEYYLGDDGLFFAFTKQSFYDMPITVEGSKVTREEENRYYFHNGQMVRWLAPGNKEVDKSGYGQQASEILEEVERLKAELGGRETGSPDDDHIDMKSLFKLSPLSIFDWSTAGLGASEKEALLKKGNSESWKITEETRNKLVFQGVDSESDAVTLYFLKNKNSADGLLAVETANGQNLAIQLWKYSDSNKSLVKSSNLKRFSANDFVSQKDKLPASYTPQLHYFFLDDQTIEVSLYAWMDKEFEEREIINRIFLKWNGEGFDEQIVKIGEAQETNSIKIIDKPNYDLSKLKYDGKIVNKRFWQDSNGENMVLFTKNESKANDNRSANLFVYHYTINSGKANQLSRVYDFEENCEYDLILEFIAHSIGVTDLDNNKLGEITFAYKKACISDVSPMELKLMMLENGNKFIMRGHTTVNLGDEKYGGDKNIDPSFKKAPEKFLSHANKIWGSINK